jgi:hypothetical protein
MFEEDQPMAIKCSTHKKLQEKALTSQDLNPSTVLASTEQIS